MNTSQFYIEKTLEANYLHVALPEDCQLDEIAVRTLDHERPDYILPFTVQSQNGKRSLRYPIGNAARLNLVDAHMRKSDFVDLYLTLLEPFFTCSEWLLTYQNFCIDPRFVFFDPQKRKARFLYIPEKSFSATDAEIVDFFRQIFTNITITDAPEFQVRLYKYFSGREASLLKLKAILDEEKPKAEMNNIFTRLEQQPVGGMKKKPLKEKVKPVEKEKEKVIPQPRKADSESAAVQSTVVSAPIEEEDSAMDLLFGSGGKKKKPQKPEKPEKSEKKPEEKKAKGGLFGGKSKKEGDDGFAGFFKEVKKEDKSSAKQSDISYEDMTVSVMEGGSADQTAELSLISSSIPGVPGKVRLDMTKGYLIIGRMSKSMQPDIAFPANFTTLGRQHAKIEFSGGKYYLTDLGSVNRTLLNDREMLPNQQYVLSDGDVITFPYSMPIKYKVVL